jgi:hypothetical protein
MSIAQTLDIILGLVPLPQSLSLFRLQRVKNFITETNINKQVASLI